jgi:VanZ family protein
MVKGVAYLWKLDRLLLALYLVALSGLLMYPFAGPEFRLLSIGFDKWMHFALFGGLAVFVRLNLSASHHAVLVSIGVAFVFAVATEVAQGMVAYRSAELLDLLAGLLGAMVGAVSMNRIVSSSVPEKPVGCLVATLGLMVGALFVLADVIGVGTSNLFGTVQLAGTALGVLITAGGVWVYVKGLRRESRPS